MNLAAHLSPFEAEMIVFAEQPVAVFVNAGCKELADLLSPHVSCQVSYVVGVGRHFLRHFGNHLTFNEHAARATSQDFKRHILRDGNFVGVVQQVQHKRRRVLF